MKRWILLLFGLTLTAIVNAQVEEDWEKRIRDSQSDARKEFEDFKRQAQNEYEDFRRKANEEYAKFMEEAWKFFDVHPSEEIPWQPKPPQPIYADNESIPEDPLPDPRIAPELVQPPLPMKTPKFTPVPEPDPEPIPIPDPINIPDPLQEEVPVPDPIPAPNTVTQEEATPIPNPFPVPVPFVKAEPIAFEGVLVAPKPIERPQPLEPIQPRNISKAATYTLYLYGSSFPFHFEKDKTLKLRDISEKSVAKMWTLLSDSYFDDIIAECLQQRDERNLCDWAYVKLTEHVAERYCGAKTNEAVVMQMYLLTQSGYQMRIARASDKLTLLMGSSEKIYRYKYFVLDNLKFYILDKSLQDAGMSVFDHAFPKEKPLSLALTQPKLNVERTEKRTVFSKRYPDVKVTVETNRNLLDFFNDYPLSAQWPYYSMASMSNVLKEDLYPVLRKAIEGKSELDAVNILLNFVQTGFEYATDDDQFGYERPLYPDETFFYSYCDCEDRSILFSCLVRELVGLDVVMLNFPKHLATAVHFNEKVAGSYLTVDDKTYIICDPTFIGAAVGRCAKEYKEIEPRVVKFYEK